MNAPYKSADLGASRAQLRRAGHSLDRVKTRTLLLLSLGCALAIVAAGVALGVRVASTPEAMPPSPIGSPVRVGDMVTVVDGAMRIGATTVISLRLGGVDDADASRDFALIVSGTGYLPVAGDCDPVRTEARPCRLEFPAPTEPGSQVVLTQTRGEEQARWVLVVE
jgi:hypothetical protein